MTKLDFPKIIKTITLTKFSHGEVKWINTPTTIRPSEFENIVPSIYGHTDMKFDFENVFSYFFTRMVDLLRFYIVNQVNTRKMPAGHCGRR